MVESVISKHEFIKKINKPKMLLLENLKVNHIVIISAHYTSLESYFLRSCKIIFKTVFEISMPSYVRK